MRLAAGGRIQAGTCEPNVSRAWYNGSLQRGSTHNFVSLECLMKVHHGCPVQATINVLSGKWKVQAVWRLSFGPLRFAELRNLLRGVSEKVLTAQLPELEKDGVTTRTAVQSAPPTATY